MNKHDPGMDIALAVSTDIPSDIKINKERCHAPDMFKAARNTLPGHSDGMTTSGNTKIKEING